jgi:hypothetical protein
MTTKNSKEQKWNSYNEKAKPQLLELFKYCQSGNKICPSPQHWNKIYHNYSWHTDRHKFTKYSPLKAPLILDAWNTSNLEKRQRFLTQIYWCYKNYFIGTMYTKIMELTNDDWHLEHYSEDKISLDLIRKEYTGWLGVKYYPEHNIHNHCANHNEEQKKVERAEKIYNDKNQILDNESITSIDSR